MRKWLLLLVASLLIVVAGCGDEDAEEPAEQEEEQNEEEDQDVAEEPASPEVNDQYAEEALAVLDEHNIAANEQDLETYLQAIPGDMKEEQRQLMEETFAQGEIEYEILDYYVEAANEDEVIVRVLQTTVAAEPIEDFEDEIAEIRHVLKQEDGEWKIFESQVVEAQPYDEEEEEGSEEIHEENAEAALDVLHKNIEAANNQDVEGYLETIPEKDHEATRNELEQEFELGEIEWDIIDHEIVSANEETVKINIVQTAVAADDIEGVDDNISEIEHTLALEDGQWKIVNSVVLSMEPYEE